MARRPLISVYDWAQDPNATITGGSWLSLLPAANMLTIQPQLVAQAVGTSVAFTLDLGTTRPIGLIHLQNLVTAVGGTIRVQAGGYDSGTVNSWATGTSGIYPSLLYAALGRPRIFIPPAPVSVSTITLTIDAVTAPLRIGYLGACEILEAPDGMLVGEAVTILDEADIQYVPFGSAYVSFRAKRRRMDFGLPPLADANGSGDDYIDHFSDVFDLALVNGKSSPIIAVPFPEDTDNLERQAVWGLATTDQQFTNRFYGFHDTTFQITQLA